MIVIAVVLILIFVTVIVIRERLRTTTPTIRVPYGPPYVPDPRPAEYFRPQQALSSAERAKPQPRPDPRSAPLPRCPKCGAAIAYSDQRCAKCGAVLAAPQ